MKLKFKVVVTAIISCVLLSSSLSALENRADEALAKGKRLYADGRYEEAMDQFIDVFVSGNTDQIAEANEYVNLIHFDRGGVVAPTQVPYDEKILKKDTESKGKDKKNNTENTENVGPLKEVLLTEKEEVIAEPESSEPEANPFNSPKSSQEVVNADENNILAEKEEVEEKPIDNTADTPTEEAQLSEEAQPTQDAQPEEVKSSDEEYILLEGKADIQRGKNIISDENSFPRGSKSKVHSEEQKDEQEKKSEMIKSLVAKLNEDEDVQVYMRAGHVDAIDINSSALFFGNNIEKISSPILDYVYALMILENSPSYVILPEGSYTDDVTLHGVRQAVSLNTYLINRGISPSKMTLNMGLTTQEPPEKFSNLAGISIVFDYEGLSRLKSKLKEKNMPPVLSLAVYPFDEIIPSAGEVFVIDFSVVQGTAPIKDWVLQIVNHASDGHYYVVKQFSGDSPLNYQAFWNGHKRYFGHLLPLGKYTIVLKAHDTEGRERILKRQVTLKEGPTNEESIVIKTESEVVKAEEFKRIQEEQEAKKLAQEGKLDYSQKRLWNKPGKKQVGTILAEEEVQSSSVVTTHSQEIVSQSTETSTTSTSEGQVTTTEQTTSYGATSNPYDSEYMGEDDDSDDF